MDDRIKDNKDVIDISKRLLENPDTLDRNIMRAFTFLLFISLIYLTLFYGLITDVTTPVGDIKLKQKILFYIGNPLLLLFSQYISMAGLSIRRIEKILEAYNFNSTTPHLRYPTIFTLIFIISDLRITKRERMFFILRGAIPIFFFYIIPLITCGHIIHWLFTNSGNWFLISISIFSAVICFIEMYRSLSRVFKKISGEKNSGKKLRHLVKTPIKTGKR